MRIGYPGKIHDLVTAILDKKDGMTGSGENGIIETGERVHATGHDRALKRGMVAIEDVETCVCSCVNVVVDG